MLRCNNFTDCDLATLNSSYSQVNIFNAAAAIHGSGDNMAAVATVGFRGFIVALVAYAFAPAKLQSPCDWII